MNRLFSMGLETLASTIVLMPVFWFFGVRRKREMLFGLYLAAVYSVTGLPGIDYLWWDPSVSLVPLVGMISDLKNSLLNLLMFVPLGFLLPALWAEFRRWKAAALFGLGMSAVIEVLQLFTYRTTDVNDLLINVTGTVVGYVLAKAVFQRLPHLVGNEKSSCAPWVLCSLVFAVMFLVQPWIASALWELL